MNSEKVKEIKESLQQEIHLTEYVDRAYAENVSLDLLKDILTLINELESENETLRNAKVVYETVDYCYEDLKKAEKRIAELEKEIEENAFYSKGYAQGIKNTYEVVIPEKLKQFAERLKEKYGKSCSEYYPLLLELTSEQLDETLKEFIND